MKNLYKLRREVLLQSDTPKVLGVPQDFRDPLIVLEHLMKGLSKQEALVFLARIKTKRNELQHWFDWSFNKQEGGHIRCHICARNDTPKLGAESSYGD